MDAVPCAHVHTFRSHSRSLVAVAAWVSYWAAVHVEWLATVPHAPSSKVAATFMYSSAPTAFTAVHWRSDVAVGAATSHVTPRVHAPYAAQLVSRWLWVALKRPAGHALHVRACVMESADIFSPCAQKFCAVHAVLVWLALSW